MARGDDKIIDVARDRFKLAVEAESEQRKREQEDLQFQVPELQWPDDVKMQRAGQTVGGVTVPARPMLSIPKLDQPVQLVLNQEKAAHLGVQIHALSEDATDDTAETLQGLYRAIERDSNAGQARSWAFDRAVKCGRGAYRVNKVWADEVDSGPGVYDQKITIERILNQAAVHLDPFAQQPDWSDGDWAFITAYVPWDRYKHKYGTTDLAGYTDGDLSDLMTDAPEWVTGDGAGRAVLIAEYFRKEYTTKALVLLENGEPADESKIPKDLKPMTGDRARRREMSVPVVKWLTMNAIEVVEKEQDWDGRYIPIIPVIGRELQPFDTNRRWVGMIGPAKDGQRLFNYAASNAVEIAALEPKAPFVGVEGQFEGHEQAWQQANVRNFPYLQYRNVSLNGTPAPAPQRMQIDASRLGPSMMLLQEADAFIQSSTATFDPTLGKMPTKDRSGKAIQALQQQADAGSSHFLDNLAQISLTYEAKVVLDLIPHVYDRAGRVARILDGEDNVQTVMLNQPFTEHPETKRPLPVPEGQVPPQALGPNDKNSKVKNFDLSKGRYGVSVSIGKSYQTRVEQGSDQLGQLIQSIPEMMPVLGDIWMKFQQWPGHMEAAERLKKMRPPQLQEDKPDQSAQLQQQMQQLSQQHELLVKELEAKTKVIETDQVKESAKVEIEKVKAATQTALQRMKDATAIRVAQIAASTKGVVSMNEAEDEALALAQEQAHETALAHADAEHEKEMAQIQQQQALEVGQQGHEQNLEASQIGHEQAIEQQMLTQPSNGSGA